MVPLISLVIPAKSPVPVYSASIEYRLIGRGLEFVGRASCSQPAGRLQVADPPTRGCVLFVPLPGFGPVQNGLTCLIAGSGTDTARKDTVPVMAEVPGPEVTLTVTSVAKPSPIASRLNLMWLLAIPMVWDTEPVLPAKFASPEYVAVTV
jgi:hypothetical protein